MLRIIVAACLVPLGGLAADLEFAGGLERVTNESILIRLAEGDRISASLPKTGDLSSEKINVQFHLADEVQITCKPKDPEHCADLRSIRFLRPPTATERFLVLGSPAPSTPPDPELKRIRQVNLEYSKNMPSFIASETAKRYTSSRAADPPVWKLVDIVESGYRLQGRPAKARTHSNQREGVEQTPVSRRQLEPIFWLGNLRWSSTRNAPLTSLLVGARRPMASSCSRTLSHLLPTAVGAGGSGGGANATTPAEPGECS